jgi:hypothetical protein
MVNSENLENMSKFIEFFNSMKELGIKLFHNEEEKEIMIKGGLEYADPDNNGFSNITIIQNGYEIEFEKYGKTLSIIVWKNWDGKRELMNAISVEGDIMVRYSSPYLYIRYREIYGIKDDIEYVDGLDGVTELLEDAGFKVFYYPEKREIRVKGGGVMVHSFVDPKILIMLYSGGSELVVFRNNNEYRLRVITGCNDIEYVLGEVGRVKVRFEDQYLIIKYPAVKAPSL